MIKENCLKKIIFIFLFLNNFSFATSTSISNIEIEKNQVTARPERENASQRIGAENSISLILRSIEKRDCDQLISLIDHNYKITNIDKKKYLELSQEQINKAFKTNLIFAEYCRIIKTMVLFSTASMGIKTLKEKITKRDDNYLYNSSLLFINFTIIYSGITDFFKIINRYDLKNKRNSTLAVETLIEKFKVI